MIAKRNIGRLGFVALIVVLGIWAFWYEPSRLYVKNYDLKIDGAKEAGLSGLKIAVIADLHAGSPYINEEKIKRVVDLTNAENPDIVLLLGDYVSHVLGGTKIPFVTVASSLGNLHAPLGVYAIMGNHDWWEDYTDIAGALSKVGIVVMDEKASEIKGNKGDLFVLAGISDYYSGPHNIGQALKDVPEGHKALCITHTPDIFPELPETCLLTLAGHTHGGQVKLPIIGRLIVPSHYGSRYAAGLVTENKHYLFVSTGIGTSLIGVRFNVPPEITILHIQ